MSEKNTNTSVDRLRETIKALLSERLGDAGPRQVEVTDGQDSEGNEAIFVDAYFDLMEPSLDPKPFTFLTTDLREAIQALGDPRFPHLRYHFDERQRVSGWR